MSISSNANQELHPMLKEAAQEINFFGVLNLDALVAAIWSLKYDSLTNPPWGTFYECREFAKKEVKEFLAETNFDAEQHSFDELQDAFSSWAIASDLAKVRLLFNQMKKERHRGRAKKKKKKKKPFNRH